MFYKSWAPLATRGAWVLATLAMSSGVALTATTLPATEARADTSPPAGVPATVSSDALPTVQIDGVVWQQTVVGNTVWAGGSFSTARPPGSAAGTNTVPRANLLAYDIRTGALVTTIAPSLNGQVTAVASSPDGSRVYVGGDFTTADGVAHARIAAYDTSTGKLVSSFAPNINGQVRAILPTGSTVFVGGAFTVANGNSRSRLAAFSASSGALLSWAPVTDGQVNALTLTPDQARVVVGGAFTNLNGAPVYGLAAVDPSSGAALPWAANSVVRDYGGKAAITSLTTDGTKIYGSGFVYGGTGNLEGTFAADPATGNIIWLEDCHGDSYSVFPSGPTVYVAGHPHYCGNIGGFPQTNPYTFHRAVAFTSDPKGTVQPNSEGNYASFAGMPAPSLLNWFPTLSMGTYTGQSQAAWSVTGNSSYIAYGGEFPAVNGAAQQGLVRFAVKTIAPNHDGPQLSSTNIGLRVTTLAPGGVRVSWPADWDRDNASLTYSLIRDGATAAPIYTTTATSTFWRRPGMGFLDKNVTPGGTYKYRLDVTDPYGNKVSSNTVTYTVPASTPAMGAYSKDVIGDGAQSYYRLDENGGATAYDWAGWTDAGVTGTVGGDTQGAINGDTDAAETFNGSDSLVVAGTDAEPGPNTFTVEAWVKTTSTAGGKIIGFGSEFSGVSSSYDRHVYMDPAGHLVFGVYPGTARTVASSGSYNDGRWHQVVASLSGAGMALYVDGRRVAMDQGTTTAQSYTGYWRIGGDTSWAGNAYFAGSIDEVAIYPSALSPQQVQQHFVDSGRAASLPQKPADAYGSAVYSSSPDYYWRLGDGSLPRAKDSGPYGNDGVYSGGVTLGVAGAVKGTTDTAAGFDGSSGLVAAANPISGPTTYSEEAWFQTTSTAGGKILGFGNANSGLSSSYDRHVYMRPNGHVVFGVWLGSATTIESSTSYNDGGWHQVVATEGAGGMRLYVDGALVASNTVSDAQSYTGYWRVGGDSSWDGNAYFNGTIDEAAFYSTALTTDDVRTHYAAGTGGAANQPPTASFTVTTKGGTASLDATGSSDPDGTVTAWSWDFGDGTTGTGATVTHTYAAGGTYAVRLTVTDNAGGTGTTSKQVSVVTNAPPSAAFTSSVKGRTASFDGSGSSDADGSIASYAWDFGDGSTGTGATPAHVYPASGGSFQVKLTVTDNGGATGTVTHTVQVAADVAPTATFTATTSGLGVTVSAAGSRDSDGTISSYSWDFGDGSTGSGSGMEHDYAAQGTFTVTLTVKDNEGVAANTSQSVTVSSPIMIYASDSFTRTVVNGWGTADKGGAWVGTSSGLAVGSGVGTVKVAAGQTLGSYLPTSSPLASELRLKVALDRTPAGGNAYVSIVGRRVASDTAYRLKLGFAPDGSVSAYVVRVQSNAETVLKWLKLPGITYASGDQLQVRFQVQGSSPTALAAKVWKVGTTEPSAWQVTVSDNTAGLQTQGAAGVLAYLSTAATNAPLTVSFDDLLVTDPGN